MTADRTLSAGPVARQTRCVCTCPGAVRARPTSDALEPSRQALSLSLRRVCALPDCRKSKRSHHDPEAFDCVDPNCPLFAVMDTHSALLPGCSGAAGKQQLLWSAGSHSAADWLSFLPSAELLSRVQLPDGVTGPLSDLQLHVCTHHPVTCSVAHTHALLTHVWALSLPSLSRSQVQAVSLPTRRHRLSLGMSPMNMYTVRGDPSKKFLARCMLT